MSLCNECKIENRENKFSCLTQYGGIASCVKTQDFHKKIFMPGTVHWLKDGKFHRNKKPAVIWYNNNEQLKHRNDKFWYQHGFLHRLDGPAAVVQCGEFLDWYQYGLRHRTDGPAVDYSVSSTKEWWIKGVQYSEEEWKVKIAKKDRKPLGNKLLLALLIPVVLLGLWLKV